MITTDEKYPNCPKTFFSLELFVVHEIEILVLDRIKKTNKKQTKKQAFKQLAFYLGYCFFHLMVEKMDQVTL